MFQEVSPASRRQVNLVMSRFLKLDLLSRIFCGYSSSSQYAVSVFLGLEAEWWSSNGYQSISGWIRDTAALFTRGAENLIKNFFQEFFQEWSPHALGRKTFVMSQFLKVKFLSRIFCGCSSSSQYTVSMFLDYRGRVIIKVIVINQSLNFPHQNEISVMLLFWLFLHLKLVARSFCGHSRCWKYAVFCEAILLSSSTSACSPLVPIFIERYFEACLEYVALCLSSLARPRSSTILIFLCSPLQSVDMESARYISITSPYIPSGHPLL